MSIPATPTNVVATLAAAQKVNITWEDNATTETVYIIERSSDGGSTWEIISEDLPPNTTSYLDETVEAETTYMYRVKARTIV